MSDLPFATEKALDMARQGITLLPGEAWKVAKAYDDLARRLVVAEQQLALIRAALQASPEETP